MMGFALEIELYGYCDPVTNLYIQVLFYLDVRESFNWITNGNDHSALVSYRMIKQNKTTKKKHIPC